MISEEIDGGGANNDPDNDGSGQNNKDNVILDENHLGIGEVDRFRKRKSIKTALSKFRPVDHHEKDMEHLNQLPSALNHQTSLQ